MSLEFVDESPRLASETQADGAMQVRDEIMQLIGDANNPLENVPVDAHGDLFSAAAPENRRRQLDDAAFPQTELVRIGDRDWVAAR